MTIAFRTVLGVACCSVAWAACGQGVIYTNTFDDDPVGVYTVQTLNADWNSPSFDNGIAQGRGTVVAGDLAFDAGRSLRIDYPRGSVGPSDSTGGGAQWRLDLDQSYDELYLGYRVRFGAGFDFVRGGKLPGFSGGTANTGGNIPDGSDGWSARMMWRTNGSGGSPATGDSAHAVQYVYHPDQPGSFGQDLRWDHTPDETWAQFASDRWYHFQHRVVMNTPGQNDGVIQAWLDGALVLNATGLRFRDVDRFGIDHVNFSTFFGGSSAIWAPTDDASVFFDDFVVSTQPIVAVPEPASGLILLPAAARLVRRDRRWAAADSHP